MERRPRREGWGGKVGGENLGESRGLTSARESLREERRAAGDGEKTSKGRNNVVGRRSLADRSKHRGPHGRQHVAIHVQGWRGGSRQGGEKPWRRNRDERWLRSTRSVGSDVVTGVDSSAAYDGEAIFGNPQERHLTAARKVLSEAEMVASGKVTRSAGGS